MRDDLYEPCRVCGKLLSIFSRHTGCETVIATQLLQKFPAGLSRGPWFEMNDHLSRCHLSNGWFVDRQASTRMRHNRDHRYELWAPGENPGGGALLVRTHSRIADIVRPPEPHAHHGHVLEPHVHFMGDGRHSHQETKA